MLYNFSLIYPSNLAPMTVKELLQKLLIPRKWRHYLRIERQVTINGQYRYFNEKVFPGEQIKLSLTHVESAQQSYLASGNLPQVVYEDTNVLVINKKKWQKTHPNLNETDTALNDCASYLGFSPYIIHRLDMLTGGLLLIAKNPAVVPILNRELTTKIFHREYLAKIDNIAKLKNKGQIAFPIGQDPNDPRKRMVRKDGLPAITHYQVLKRNPDNTGLVKTKLETGRTHQIRVHLAHLACPIIGDPLYNPNSQAGQDLQLTAYQLSFIAPYSFKKVQVSLFK